ncbi:hypothetical protein LV164_008120 [Aspergillus fumigatus]|nr:hypothetical protein KXX38_007440 [Aspergillus fumigatus]KAH1384593.1 hypothetical protein KXX49_005044 [Aspergillus fumigatus]KAH1456535.1 hypothetical protein KXX58_000526 [Aspergillus fumigatus]KAH1486847.1 hypothetical protein KXX42_004397 [Aspergillus fumigatus]KAH1741978.1 hypothetical protein KXX09_001458 [Aspergillus fumigatus]
MTPTSRDSEISAALAPDYATVTYSARVWFESYRASMTSSAPMAAALDSPKEMVAVQIGGEDVNPSQVKGQDTGVPPEYISMSSIKKSISISAMMLKSRGESPEIVPLKQ